MPVDFIKVIERDFHPVNKAQFTTVAVVFNPNKLVMNQPACLFVFQLELVNLAGVPFPEVWASPTGGVEHPKSFADPIPTVYFHPVDAVDRALALLLLKQVVFIVVLAFHTQPVAEVNAGNSRQFFETL